MRIKTWLASSPGDAIYVPSLWWHGVLTIAGLDDAQRRAWRDYFDYYVFRTGENPAAHLPAGIKDIVTSLNPEQARSVSNFLSQRLIRTLVRRPCVWVADR